MDKRWLEQYQKGVPEEIDPRQYSSIVSLFEESCHHHTNNIAYSNLGSYITYKKLDQLSRDFAAYLQQLGLERNAKIAIIMPNLLQYPVVLFAILRAGYVVVNTNPLYTCDEIIHQLNDSDTQVAIVLANFAKTLEKALPSIPSLRHVIITEMGDLFPAIKGMVTKWVVKYIKKLVPSYSIPHAVAFNYALQEGKQSLLHAVDLNHKDIAFLQYTGGTTGLAKGAMLTHGNIIANLLQAQAWISPLCLSHKDKIVTAIPLYHIFSLTANCLLFLKIGAENLLITNPRDTDHFIKEIKKSGFTIITGVNTLYKALLNHPTCKEIDFSKLKLALAGGMALQKQVSVHWYKLSKNQIIEAYGLTETSPAVSINPINLKSFNGSVGLPISSTEASIRDVNEKEVPIGEHGELCVKGPQVMAGYWNKPKDTALAFTHDGFLKTGDIAKMDEEGFIYLIDRKKDMILVSGFNVYPNEVEHVIGMHPGVLEVGVIGITDEEHGEQVVACIVKKDLDLTAVQIINYCKEHLTAYKIPKKVEFLDTLPRSNLGKILRRSLKASLRERK